MPWFRRFRDAIIWSVKDIWLSFRFYDNYLLARTPPLKKKRLWFYGVAAGHDGKLWLMEIALPAALPRRARVSLRIRTRPLDQKGDRRIIEQVGEKIPLGSPTSLKIFDTGNSFLMDKRKSPMPSLDGSTIIGKANS
jgi:hypothetical protein